MSAVTTAEAAKLTVEARPSSRIVPPVETRAICPFGRSRLRIGTMPDTSSTRRWRASISAVASSLRTRAPWMSWFSVSIWPSRWFSTSTSPAMLASASVRIFWISADCSLKPCATLFSDRTTSSSRTPADGSELAATSVDFKPRDPAGQAVGRICGAGDPLEPDPGVGKPGVAGQRGVGEPPVRQEAPVLDPGDAVDPDARPRARRDPATTGSPARRA